MISRHKLRTAVGGSRGETRSRILAFLVLAVCLLAMPRGAGATSATWSGLTDDDYNTLTNWAGLPASIPGTGAAETASFSNTGGFTVNISAATANAVEFAFSHTTGTNYTITVADGVHQELTGVTAGGGGNNGWLELRGTGTGTYTLSGIRTFTTIANQEITVSSVVTDAGAAGGINANGAGALILSGANTYSGGTTLTAGSLYVGGNNALGTGDLTINGGNFQATAGTTVSIANNITVGGDFAIGGNSSLTMSGTVDLGAATRALTINNTAATNLTGIISGNVGTGLSINNAGGNTLTLSGVNTFDGGLTLTAGTLAAANARAFGAITNALVVNGGTADFSGLAAATPVTLGSLAGAGALNLGGIALTCGDATSTAVSGVISGTGASLTKVGAGTLTLSGNNTYTGGTTLTAGTLAAGHNSAFGSGALTINGGTLQAAAATTPTLGNAVTVGGDFAFGGADAITLSGTVGLGAATRTLTITNTAATNLSGIISGNAGTGLSINNTGGNTLTLSGVNTFDGGLTLTAGTLAAANARAFGAITNALVANGGTADFSGLAAATPVTLGSLAGAGAFNLGGIALTCGDATSTAVSGVISGAGGTLTKVGAGTLTLSGNNTYTGGTTLTAGTLAAGDDNALGTGTLTLNGGTLQGSGAAHTLPNNTTLTADSTITGVAAGLLTLNGTFALGANTLTVNGTGNVTVAQAISGTGGLGVSNTGGGNLTLSALNTYTGPTTVSTGGLLTVTAGMQNWNTMTVDGTVAGDVTNTADATLGGSGTITGSLVNNGTVNPGNSPGTLTVGTYTSNPGSTQIVEIASAASYDKIVVTGAGGVTLNGGTLTPILLGGYLPVNNQIFTNVISNTGGGLVTGTFASVANTQTLLWRAIYNADSVDLQAYQEFAGLPGSRLNASLSPNQRSVANMLNALPPASGDLLEVLNAINALTTAEGVRAAYNNISPEKYASLPTLAFPITHLQFQYLLNRLARQRWEAKLGSEAVSRGAGGFMRGFSFGYDNTRMLLASSSFTLSDAGNPLIRPGVNHRWGIYLEPMANWGSLRPSANLVGYHYKNFGFTLGADYWIMDNWLVGANTGYSRTLTGIGGTGGDINANIIPFNAYTAFFLKGFYVNGTMGYTYSNYDMERKVAYGTINRTAKANTSGNQFQAAAETGYDVKAGNAIVGPTVTLQYATQTTGGFTESNAGALNLRVGSQTAYSLQTGVGARASYRAKVGNVTVKPQVSVVWQHEFSQDTRGVNARLALGSTTMNWRTDKIGQNFAVVSVDVPARISKNLVVHAGYTAEVGRSKSSNQGVSLGLRYAF